MLLFVLVCLPSRSAGQEAQALPRVVLEERVPRAWLHNNPDDFPLTPARRRRRLPRRCRTRGGYRDYCQGARLVPEPTGPAKAVAERLGLGLPFTARILISEPPLPEWMDAVADSDPDGRLDFPVPGGHLGRGFGYVRHGSLRRRRHKGVDIGAPEGSTIVAARGGLVAYSDNGLTGYGNVVILLHKDGLPPSTHTVAPPTYSPGSASNVDRRSPKWVRPASPMPRIFTSSGVSVAGSETRRPISEPTQLSPRLRAASEPSRP